ncbi:hypothetical protein DSL72_009011 [Monilinia vaccinii-corymbosi]|uniref:Uncharacterized protein n=1 Tax=Monilinia vaccinii-corymbosi TaxID=61207 RepID=A0A8A3PPX8_9HELO|nr:hypothetical protein DSL72_009011 [Monilinia vaccinii-corymbosi]
MDEPGIDADPSSGLKTPISKQSISIISSNASLSVLECAVPSYGRMTTASNGGPSQRRSFRNTLPKPSKSLELGMEGSSAEGSDVAGSQMDIVEEPLLIVAEKESANVQTPRCTGNPTSASHEESEESDDSVGDNESHDSEHFDSDDANSYLGEPEPSTSEPQPASPTSQTPIAPPDKVRRADTMFTKTELIALGVAYATEASWPRIAEYFPHRTPRSLYQTFKHTFTHAGNGHKLARDSYPPGADIPELRKKFQALRKLASRTRRVPLTELPKEYDQDIIRGHLSLSRWQKKGRKTSVVKKVKVPKLKPVSAREKHMRVLQEQWDDEDDESDFEDVRAAAAVAVKKERVKKEHVKEETINSGGATVIKVEGDTTDQDQLTGLPESSIIDLDVRDPSELRSPMSEPSLEGKKSRLIDQLSQCENAEELNRILMNGLEISEVKAERRQKEGKSERLEKRKRI